MNAAQVSEWLTGMEEERDALVSALTEAEQDKSRLRREILVAQNAAKDIERLKDAEIAKLKARLAAAAPAAPSKDKVEETITKLVNALLGKDV